MPNGRQGSRREDIAHPGAFILRTANGAGISWLMTMAEMPIGIWVDTMATEPVRLYADDDRRVPRRLLDRLKYEHQQAFAELVYAQDWADYTARRSKIFSLGDAIKWCEEIERELTG